MFNSDYQINKDFDINNLFLNLTFHDQTEEFEFKEPLLDHPSNYQMIVTKFFSKLNFPFIQLHESKKNSRLLLQQGDNISMTTTSMFTLKEQEILMKARIA